MADLRFAFEDGEVEGVVVVAADGGAEAAVVEAVAGDCMDTWPLSSEAYHWRKTMPEKVVEVETAAAFVAVVAVVDAAAVVVDV